MHLTLGYTVLYVADVERTLSFYTEAFGLPQRFRHPGGQYAELDTGTTVLAFAEHEFAASTAGLLVSPTRPDDPPPALNLTLVTDDVPGALTRAVRAGADQVTDVVVKPWGQTVALVRDLDGVLIELATPTGRDQPTDTAGVRHLIGRYFQAWNTGDLDILDDVIAADYVNHSAGIPDVPLGPYGLRPIIAGMRAGFPDLHYEVDHMVIDGDVVAVRTTVSGTHAGPLFGQPPTGRAFRTTQMQFERISGGRIVEHWRLTDETTMNQQLRPGDPE